MNDLRRPAIEPAQVTRERSEAVPFAVLCIVAVLLLVAAWLWPWLFI